MSKELAVGPLPSFTSLRLLITAGRENNLSTAAERVGLTQSAASRRISALEAELGIPLLERHRRGVRLTAQGQWLLSEISPAMDRITGAIESLKASGGSGPLRLRVYSTFASRWLLPRLPDFQSKYPDIDIRLDTTVSPLSFGGDEKDLAICYGDGHWTDATSQLLIGDEIEPVCTPEFARRHNLVGSQSIPLGVRLLESRYLQTDWTDWSRSSGTSVDGLMKMRFPSSLLAYQAAMEGLGLAIAQRSFVAGDLAKGSLTAPFSHPVRRQTGFYLVWPTRGDSRHVRAFRSWIVEQLLIRGPAPDRGPP
jgi:LysR family glycine cleavage system transcriptional activator